MTIPKRFCSMLSGAIRTESERYGIQSVGYLPLSRSLGCYVTLTWRAVLTVALESSSDSSAAAKAVRKLKHESRVCELEEAKKLAAYRSGARGLKARKELRLLEEELDAFLKM